MADDVNHPAHYGGEDNPYEAIKVIEAHNLGFALGNSVKYILRAGHKIDLTNAYESGGDGTRRNVLKAKIKDLKKAQWYLTHELETAAIELKHLETP